jgi:hypothetical protein
MKTIDEFQTNVTHLQYDVTLIMSKPIKFHPQASSFGVHNQPNLNHHLFSL